LNRIELKNRFVSVNRIELFPPNRNALVHLHGRELFARIVREFIRSNNSREYILTPTRD